MLIKVLEEKRIILNENKKVLKRFYILTGIAGLSIVLIFVFATYYRAWGKRFSALPLKGIVILGFCGATQIITTFVWTYYVYKNFDIICGQTEQREKKRMQIELRKKHRGKLSRSRRKEKDK